MCGVQSRTHCRERMRKGRVSLQNSKYFYRVLWHSVSAWSSVLYFSWEGGDNGMSWWVFEWAFLFPMGLPVRMVAGFYRGKSHQISSILDREETREMKGGWVLTREIRRPLLRFRFETSLLGGWGLIVVLQVLSSKQTIFKRPSCADVVILFFSAECGVPFLEILSHKANSIVSLTLVVVLVLREF